MRSSRSGYVSCMCSYPRDRSPVNVIPRDWSPHATEERSGGVLGDGTPGRQTPLQLLVLCVLCTASDGVERSAARVPRSPGVSSVETLGIWQAA